MKILITGVAGFIGSSLAKVLVSEGHEVVGIDNFHLNYSMKIKENNISTVLNHKNFIFYNNDICIKQDIEFLFQKYNFDIIIHLAALVGVRDSITQPNKYFETNVQAYINILESLKNSKSKRIIFASSSSVYGNSKVSPLSETFDCSFQISPYAASKKAAEIIGYSYYELYKFSIINLRFFTVYGPRQRPDLAIHKFFNCLYNDKAIDIYGDGNSLRDYTYIDDIIRGIQYTIEFLTSRNVNTYETINLGSANPIKLIDVVYKIQEVTNEIFRINFHPMQMGDVDCTYADINKARKMLGYNPTVRFSDGLIEFKNWFNKHREILCAE